MALFLSQHGLSEKKKNDSEKKLTDKGIEKTNIIAGVAKNYKIPVKGILHSDKKRSLQTAEIFHNVIDPSIKISEIKGINPLDDAIKFSASINPDSNILIVSHLPFLDKLLSFLTTGNTENKIYRFQNSGIVCLGFERDNWFIKWTLNPDIN